MNFSERYTWAVSKLKHICPSKMYLWVGYRKFPTHFTIEIIFHKKGIRPAGQPTKPYLIHNTSEVVSQIHSSGWSSGPGRRDPVAQKHESWGLSLHRIFKNSHTFLWHCPCALPRSSPSSKETPLSRPSVAVTKLARPSLPPASRILKDLLLVLPVEPLLLRELPQLSAGEKAMHT